MALQTMLHQRGKQALSLFERCPNRAQMYVASVSWRHRPGALRSMNRAGAGADKASSKAFRLSVLSTSSSQKKARAMTSIVHQPTPPATGLGTAQNFLVVALVGMFAAYVGKSLWGRGQSRMGYEDRGSLDQSRYMRKDRLQDVMKNVNTCPLPELSNEQISAARARRQKDRAVYKISMDDVELPENHPWAMKAPGQQQDALLTRARMPRRFTQAAQQQQQPQVNTPSAAEPRPRGHGGDNNLQHSSGRQSRMRAANSDAFQQSL